MTVRRLVVRGFRNLRSQEIRLGGRVTLLWGPNGAGKTNVLEALCVALSGRSCRTRDERETIAFEHPLARVEVEIEDGAGGRRFMWSISRSGERRRTMNGHPLVPDTGGERPPLSIFLPERLALIKGPPAGRREHLDHLAAAIWPAHAQTRKAYGRALAQRNALLSRVRAGLAPGDSLEAWDAEVARVGVELMGGRRRLATKLALALAGAAGELGLPAEAALAYRPRARTEDTQALAEELRERRDADVRAGRTTCGPHLDELELSLGGRSVRRYGSQGEQRSVLLALLLAERRALLEARGTPPLMLLDDVMSELDAERRAVLARVLAEGEGQALVTSTEPAHLLSGCERAEYALRQGEAIASPGAVTGEPERVAA